MWPAMTRGDLEAVYAHIQGDVFWDHLRLPGIKLVPGFGATAPDVMLVGEAPGATENARGRPFCGASGRVLDGLLSLADLRLTGKWSHGSVDHPETTGDVPANAFITNVVKYRPPQNRTPTPEEIEHGRIALRAEWTALGRPFVIVCIGGVAHRAIHPRGNEAISTHAGRAPVGGDRPRVLISSQFHPAYALRRGPATQARCEKHWEQLGDYLRDQGIL